MADWDKPSIDEAYEECAAQSYIKGMADSVQRAIFREGFWAGVAFHKALVAGVKAEIYAESH